MREIVSGTFLKDRAKNFCPSSNVRSNLENVNCSNNSSDFDHVSAKDHEPFKDLHYSPWSDRTSRNGTDIAEAAWSGFVRQLRVGQTESIFPSISLHVLDSRSALLNASPLKTKKSRPENPCPSVSLKVSSKLDVQDTPKPEFPKNENFASQTEKI